jgi:hypothetical protein
LASQQVTGRLALRHWRRTRPAAALGKRQAQPRRAQANTTGKRSRHVGRGDTARHGTAWHGTAHTMSTTAHTRVRSRAASSWVRMVPTRAAALATSAGAARASVRLPPPNTACRQQRMLTSYRLCAVGAGLEGGAKGARYRAAACSGAALQRTAFPESWRPLPAGTPATGGEGAAWERSNRHCAEGPG